MKRAGVAPAFGSATQITKMCTQTFKRRWGMRWKPMAIRAYMDPAERRRRVLARSFICLGVAFRFGGGHFLGPPPGAFRNRFWRRFGGHFSAPRFGTSL